MNSRKYFLIQVLCVLGIILFSCIDLFMYRNKYFEEKKVTLKYQETESKIDYRVYLKKNDFFDTEYLEKKDGKSYIASLINYIKVDYNYNIKFDHPVSGDYRYYISATIEANKSNNEKNYWSEDYKITDEKSMSIKELSEFSIHENVDVDYNKYNSILNSFKKKYSLSTANGVLKIYLNVDSKLKTNINDNVIDAPISSKMMIQVPLSEMTIDALVEESVPTDIKEVSVVVDATRVEIFRTLGYIYIGAVVICIILLVVVTNAKKNLNRYENELKKILNTYDGIIVNIKKIPDLTDYNIINVSSFNELLDAHSEVRMPINFFKGEYKSYFILLSEKNAWKYTMSRKKMERM